MGKKRNKGKDKFELLGNIVAGFIIALFFGAIPLYFRNGYQKIATHKYKLMMEGSLVIVAILIIYLIVIMVIRGISSKDIKKYKAVRLLDISVLSYAIVSIVSYIFSIYQKYGEPSEYWFIEGALYGTEGWYMGLCTVIVMVIMYFAISRTLTYSDKVWIPVCAVSTLIFVWAILNRFEIYPVEMAFQTEKFLSTIGNINWLAGYSSVVMPVIIGLYWKNQDRKLDRILIFPLIVTLSNVLMNGSDSLVFSFLIVMVVLLMLSCKDKLKMRKFLEIMMWFTFNGFLIYCTDNFYEITRTDFSELGKIFDGGLWSLIWFILFLVAYIYMDLSVKAKCKYPEWLSENLGKVTGYLVIIAGLIFFFLLVINTQLGNTIPGIRNIGLFYFDYEWGTRRGAILQEAFYVFKDELWWQKIVGTGPDTFYFQLLNTPGAMRINDYIFGESRLTNAHSEMVTILINQGILGFCSFASIIVIAINQFKKAVSVNEGFVIYVLAVVMYVTNNLISFQTILNTPMLFVLLGIGASQLVGKYAQK